MCIRDSLIVGSLLYVLNYFKDANSASIIDYETEQPFYTSIKKEVVATGKLNPEDGILLQGNTVSWRKYMEQTNSKGAGDDWAEKQD